MQLAIIRQESTFQFNARPPRKKLLGIIPWKRPSDAYGYAQALESTWAAYKKDTGRRGADRDDFSDAIDFVGWYTDQSQRIAGISKWDPYNQYLAYHDGQGGWLRKSYRFNGELKGIARSVDYRAKEWGAQLQRCEDGLDDGWCGFIDCHEESDDADRFISADGCQLVASPLSRSKRLLVVLCTPTRKLAVLPDLCSQHAIHAALNSIGGPDPPARVHK